MTASVAPSTSKPTSTTAAERFKASCQQLNGLEARHRSLSAERARLDTAITAVRQVVGAAAAHGESGERRAEHSRRLRELTDEQQSVTLGLEQVDAALRIQRPAHATFALAAAEAHWQQTKAAVADAEREIAARILEFSNREITPLLAALEPLLGAEATAQREVYGKRRAAGQYTGDIIMQRPHQLGSAVTGLPELLDRLKWVRP